MKSAKYGLAFTFAAGLAIGGCAQDDKHDDHKHHRHDEAKEMRREGRAMETTTPRSTTAPAARQLPSNVRAGFDREFPGATIREVQKETYPDGTVHWEVEFTTKDGKEMEKEFDEAGKLLAEH